MRENAHTGANGAAGNGKRPEVVVITGASAGVGRATAQAFAQHGAHGPFDSRAHRSSPYLWETTHWQWVTLACMGLAGCAAATLWHRKQ